ncbi:hypothetical protein Taro_051769, partial [Colocasia esculenta]|nr:hypothetical protein [Colocasia esculenta]
MAERRNVGGGGEGSRNSFKEAVVEAGNGVFSRTAAVDHRFQRNLSRARLMVEGPSSSNSPFSGQQSRAENATAHGVAFMAPLVLVDVCMCATCRSLGKHAGVSRLKATAEYVVFRARFDEFSPRGRYVEWRKRRASIVLRVLREGSKEFGVIRMMDFGLGFAPAKATTLGIATKSRHRDTSRSEGDLSCRRVLKATLHPVAIAAECCYPRIHLDSTVLCTCLVERQLDLSSVAARLRGSPVWFVWVSNWCRE